MVVSVFLVQNPWPLVSFCDIFLIRTRLFLVNLTHRAYEERAGEVVRLLKELGVPTTDRDLEGQAPQDLSPGIEF